MMDVVLVHGAWHGPWAWDGVVNALEDLGVEADPVELPFTGFDDDVAVARAAIEAAGADVVVCGHSYGGSVISAAARRLPVRHLVYLCAFMVDEDEDAMATWLSEPVALHGAIVDVDGRMGVDPEQAHECFYADADPTQSAEVISRLRTMPGAAGAVIDATAPAWHDAPSTYVVCTRDQAIHPAVQRAMARHADRVVEWPADHSPFLSSPQRVAELLAELVPGSLRSAPVGR
jgi:pimeloyl-ACP methyl ester carboxylesterase